MYKFTLYLQKYDRRSQLRNNCLFSDYPQFYSKSANNGKLKGKNFNFENFCFRWISWLTRREMASSLTTAMNCNTLSEKENSPSLSLQELGSLFKHSFQNSIKILNDRYLKWLRLLFSTCLSNTVIPSC